MIKKFLLVVIFLILAIALVGIYKFNCVNDDIYFQNEQGDYVNQYGKKVEFL